jgi:hypothetical protein
MTRRTAQTTARIVVRLVLAAVLLTVCSLDTPVLH